MSWRESALVLDALATQGYYEEDDGLLRQDVLAASLRDVWVKNPVHTSSEDLLVKKGKVIKAGLSSAQLVDRMLPGFREKVQLSDEEAKLLKKDPRSYPELEERAKAVSDVTTLMWGTMCRTSRSGAVQTLLIQKGLLLVEAKISRENVPVTVKVATDDQDLIIEYYVRPRGDQLVKVSGSVRDDCAMVGMTFDGITDRMKRELGISVTTAVSRLMQVATPDFAALEPGSASAPAPRAVTSGASKA